MRIAILGSRGFPIVYSGFETLVSELAPRMAERGHEVTIYCHRNLFTERPKFFKGVRLVYIPSVERKTLSQFTHSLLSTLHVLGRRYDVVFFVNAANGPFGILIRWKRALKVINVDGMEWLRPKWHGLGKKYFLWAAKMATRHFDVIITDCERMKEKYLALFGTESSVIAYGAYPGEHNSTELISQLGLSPRSYYLVVGRLIPDNNADLVVRAFKSREREKQLVIVGDVPYKDEYAQSVKSLSGTSIVMLGYVRDSRLLEELYVNCYAYVHGHEFGGTNPTLVQALATGCCIIALDTEFNREVLADGTYGLLFQKEKDDLSETMSRLENDHALVETYRALAPKRARESYQWAQIADMYEQEFQSANQRRPDRDQGTHKTTYRR